MSCEELKTKSTGLACVYEAEEKTHVTFRGDVASDLNDKAFKVHTTENTYLVVLDVDSAITKTAGTGETLVAVAVAEGASAGAIAQAVQTALDLKTDLEVSVEGSQITIVNSKAGYVEPVALDPSTSEADFVIKQCQKGGLDELGFTEGDTEFTGFTPETEDVVAHQTGSTPLGTINKGVAPQVSLVLLETDIEKLKLAFSSIGSEIVYDGVTGFGVGTGKIGKLLNQSTRRLRFYNYSDSENKSQWITFWKAAIIPDTLTFSTETPDKISLSFQFYPDNDLPAAFKDGNIFYVGDISKVVPVPSL